jgi:hypothetical protein
MEEPEGRAAPLYVHGPVMAGAVCTAILPFVENRKYVPSERRMMAGSWALVQVPVQLFGFA